MGHADRLAPAGERELDQAGEHKGRGEQEQQQALGAARRRREQEQHALRSQAAAQQQDAVTRVAWAGRAELVVAREADPERAQGEQGQTEEAGAGHGRLSLVAPTQAASDAQLVALWLHGRPEGTRRVYSREVKCFLDTVGKPLPLVTIGDVQGFVDTRGHLAPATRARIVNTLRSLCTFAHTIGYARFNVTAAVRAPKVKDRLGERILSQSDIFRMLHQAEPEPRNHALLVLAYASGGRVSELVGLSWRDVQPREQAGQVVLYGKGGKTRAVVLPEAAWRVLLELGRGSPGDPVFVSRQGSRLSAVQAWRIVRKVAEKAGIPLPVSPHWWRHAHASHALDRHAPVHVVQQTLGHASLATTSRYAHARPGESSGGYLGLEEL